MASCIRLRLELPPMISSSGLAPMYSAKQGFGLGQAVKPSVVAAIEAVHGLEILAAQTVQEAVERSSWSGQGLRGSCPE